ncbi:MAG: hypothetical protein FD167_590 [bacterium]|nr:MAG: hypothetical protein FD167_590 [bacterium]
MSKSKVRQMVSMVKLELPPTIKVNEGQFFDFCQVNKDLRIERDTSGELIIMSPTGGKTGRRNFTLIKLLSRLEDNNSDWVGFDSSTGFRLPNGAIRSPDVAFLRKTKWESLTSEQQEKFIPLCPDFVIELRSATDSLVDLKEKMQEYINNGSSLGWLIDPLEKKVHVYSISQQESLINPTSISAAPFIFDFVLQLTDLWR